MRPITTLLLLGLATAGFPQKPSDLLGTWVADSKSVASDERAKKIQITFLKGNKLTLKGYNTVGMGTYSLTKDRKLTITLTERNGVKPVSKVESVGIATLSKDGKTIEMETGVTRNGKRETLKLVRKG